MADAIAANPANPMHADTLYDPIAKRTRCLFRWDDIGYYVVMTTQPLRNDPDQPPYHAEVSVYPISGWEDLECKVPFFRKAETVNGGPIEGCVSVSDIDEAEALMDGSIKWDACCNFHFNPYDAHCLHFCGKNMALQFGTLLGRLYDAAQLMMPQHKGISDT